MIRLTLVALLVGAVSSDCFAQPYSIDSFTIDGGGGESSGGTFDITGTIGQHDAGGPMVGGSYEVVGGFWAGADGACNAADLAAPLGVLDFSDVVAFLTAFGSMLPAADLAPPFGVFDFSDVVAFLSAFGSGCP